MLKQIKTTEIQLKHVKNLFYTLLWKETHIGENMFKIATFFEQLDFQTGAPLTNP